MQDNGASGAAGDAGGGGVASGLAAALQARQKAMGQGRDDDW